MERWLLKNPKLDIGKMSQALGVSELLCRIMVNRQVTDIIDAEQFIKPDIGRLCDPRLMKDLSKGVYILKNKINEGKKIRIVGDYDVDGVISTYVLYRSLKRLNALVDYEIPHRIADGYGINIGIIENAINDGIDTIITCDNGIAALEQIEYAKAKGLTVIITDHHDVHFVDDDKGTRVYRLPCADAVIDIKQTDCNYPFKTICGAAVAYKLIQVLFEEFEIPGSEAFELIEFVAIATICDVVDLIGENRVFVKIGLEMINNTRNIGLRALISQTGIEGKTMNAYFLGYIIGPCINASGRLDCAKRGLKLLISEDLSEAAIIAKELFDLNTERKSMTIEGVNSVIDIIENSEIKNDKVLLVYKPEIHESIAGIIAGKIKDKYNVPTIILTAGENGVKGSGRSIEEYNMFEELLKCKDLLGKFGGHPMAAGLSLEEKNIGELRDRLNAYTSLTDEELIPKVYIDARLRLESINLSLAEELNLLEPYGKGNSKPLFAQKEVSVLRCSILGVKKNVMKLKLGAGQDRYLDCIYFGDIEAFKIFIAEKFGQDELEKLLSGRDNSVKLDIVFNIDINEYNGNKSVQLIMQYYRDSQNSL